MVLQVLAVHTGWLTYFARQNTGERVACKPYRQSDQ